MTAHPGPCTILVVEDYEDLREVLCEMLAQAGYAVIAAAHGADALARLAASPVVPCLALVDLMMPVMDGWTLHHHLLADERLRAMQFVAMTASTLPPPPGVPRVAKGQLDGGSLIALVRAHARCGGGAAASAAPVVVVAVAAGERLRAGRGGELAGQEVEEAVKVAAG